MNTIKKYNAAELPEIVRYGVKVARNNGKVGETKQVSGYYVIVKTADDGEWHALNEVLDKYNMRTKTLVFSKTAKGEGYDRAVEFAKKCQSTWGKAVVKGKKAKTLDGIIGSMTKEEKDALVARLLAA